MESESFEILLPRDSRYSRDLGDFEIPGVSGTSATLEEFQIPRVHGIHRATPRDARDFRVQSILRSYDPDIPDTPGTSWTLRSLESLGTPGTPVILGT